MIKKNKTGIDDDDDETKQNNDLETIWALT